MQFYQVAVNGKQRKVEASEKLASNSKLDLKYSPATQPRVDPVKKAVQQLAKKDLLSFAAAVRCRICLGKPNKEQDEQKGVQQGAKKDGFAQTVDKHIQKFEPYFCLTGLTAEKFKNDATASYSTRNQDAHPTDDQLQEMAEECCSYVELMQDIMPHECQLAMHFDWVKSHLFGLH